MYYDSNNYIYESINLIGLGTNPIGYPLFIRAFSWQFTLWPVVIAQAFIVNLLIYFVIRSLYKNKPIYKLHFTVVLILSFFTGMSWVSSIIMADIFVPIAIMSLYLFFSKDTKLYIKTFSLVCIAFSAIVHFIIPLILITIILIWVIQETLIIKRSLKFVLYKSILLILIIITVMIFNKNYNPLIGKEKPPSVSQILMVARLMENGILDEFLEANCEDNRYSLCELKGKFPNSPAEFVWTEGGPLSQTGGWNLSKEEYNEIIYRVFTNPYYVSEFFYKSCISTIKQFFTFQIRFMTFDKNNALIKTINNKFQTEGKEFNRSLQLGSYDWNSLRINNLYYVSFTISLIILALYFGGWRSKDNYNLDLLIFITLLGVIINAAISGSFSNVVPRYQARVNWLIVFTALLVFHKKLQYNFNKISRFVNNQFKK